MNSISLNTPLGTAVISGDKNGICRVSINSEKPVADPAVVMPHLTEAATQLTEYFTGERKVFDLDLNPSGTTFQLKVWRLLEEIPFGRTSSYLEISKALQNPAAVRAVAAANAKNPLWILIPCHRVVGSDGSLTGYAGGLWRKKWLLQHEQTEKQQTIFD